MKRNREVRGYRQVRGEGREWWRKNSARAHRGRSPLSIPLPSPRLSSLLHLALPLHRAHVAVALVQLVIGDRQAGHVAGPVDAVAVQGPPGERGMALGARELVGETAPRVPVHVVLVGIGVA